MTKTLNFLIGDDGFTSRGAVKSDLLLIFSNFWKHSMEKQEKPITISLEEGIYTCRYLPFGEVSQIKVRAIPTVEGMIEEAKNNYDWIITDLNYGPGHEEGGIRVIHSLSPNIKENSILAIWTNEDNPESVKKLNELGVNYIVSPKLIKYNGTKAELLGKIIAEHYFK